MIRYYGRMGAGEYVGVVKIEDACRAYVYHLKKKKYVRDDYFLCAAYDPGTDYWEVNEEEAQEIINDLLEE